MSNVWVSMHQLTASGWSRAWQSSSVAELRLLSAVLHSPGVREPSRDDHVSRSCRQITYAPKRPADRPVRRVCWLPPHNTRKPRSSATRREFHSVRQGQAAQPVTKADFWPVEDDWNSDVVEGPAKPAQKGGGPVNKQSAPTKLATKSRTCSLCSQPFDSEEAFDEHLVACWPRHNPSPAESDVTEDEAATQSLDWSIDSEKEKLEQVRRLEDELRKARHELQTMSRKRQVKSGVTSIVDVYSATHEAPDVPLLKQDYLNLVDLYFHATQSNSAVSPDASPNPIFLEDQSYESQTVTTQAGSDTKTEEPGLDLLASVDQKLRSDKLKEIKTVEAFVDLLLDERTPYEQIFQAYQRFPTPGVRFLPAATIRTFLHRLALPPLKTPQAMLRYLSVIDEMQAAKLPISRAEWNAGIHLAGKSFHSIGTEDIDRSLSYWKKMEGEAGIRASSATFNILFDVAVKAGQFLLAKELFTEMGQRKLRLNRMGRVSHIWSLGKLGNADAVRQAYHDFVEAGEVVDTLVLNTVMVALCNCGEGEAAEQIYERMKSMRFSAREAAEDDRDIQAIFTRYPPPGPQSFGSQMAANHLRRILIHAPKIRNIAPDSHLAHHERAYLKPDSVTYRTLLAYHAEKTGNLDRVTVLLDDMINTYGMRMSSMIFLLLFKGFAMNGNTKHSKWSASRLSVVWETFLSGMRENSKAQGMTVSEISAFDTASLHANDKMEKDSKPASQPRKVFLGDEFFSQFDVDGTNFDKKTQRGSPRSPSTDTESNADDIDLMRSRVFDGSPWGRFLRDFAATDEEKSELDLATDPAGRDEPQAFPFRTNKTNESDDYYKIRPSKWLIIWALRAFATCTKDRRLVEEAYFDLVDNWYQPTQGQRNTVQMVAQSCLQDIDKGIHDKQWWRKRQAARRSLRAQW